MYEPSERIQAQVRTAFTYHPPQAGLDQVGRYTQIRDEAHSLAQTITKLTPESREQSLALTNLEQVVMWGNAAIARHEKGQG